jgi:hypothetical protein
MMGYWRWGLELRLKAEGAAGGAGGAALLVWRSLGGQKVVLVVGMAGGLADGEEAEGVVVPAVGAGAQNGRFGVG